MSNAVTKQQLRDIASRCDQRWNYFYTKSKLGTDPVYAAVVEELKSSSLPVLDIGCGMGLLAHYLRAAGLQMPVEGFDFDARKIRSAEHMAAAGSLQDVRFTCGDARSGLDAFAGNVVILDVLQYLGREAQDALVADACSRVAHGGKFIIRTGLEDGSWRYKITVAGDLLAKATRWMKAAPVVYPSAQSLTRIFSACGLTVRIQPLWGGTPFNNHLVVAERA